jgi:hypothetical protein
MGQQTDAAELRRWTVIRTRTAGTRILLIGLTATAVGAGSAAAAMPVLGFRVHARLAPVAGANYAGRFNGLLVRNADGTVVPRVPLGWELSWRLRLPSLGKPIDASLRVRAANGAPRVVRMLCSGCTATAHGTLTLTASQALRVARSRAVVVVRASSESLRGVVRASRVRG